MSKEELLNALYLEFVNRVNEVGVDVNRCVNQSHTAPLIQFVCGLGPRKGYQLLKVKLDWQSSMDILSFLQWFMLNLKKQTISFFKSEELF